MKKNISNIILLIMSIIVVIVLVFFIIFKSEKTIDKNVENGVNPNRYFNCVKPDVRQNEYTVSSQYEFSFKEDILNYGKTINIVKFDNIEAYDAYKFNTSEDLEFVEKLNKEKLTKTYEMYYWIPQKSESDNKLDDYIKMLEEQEWKCTENKNVNIEEKVE